MYCESGGMKLHTLSTSWLVASTWGGMAPQDGSQQRLRRVAQPRVGVPLPHILQRGPQLLPVGANRHRSILICAWSASTSIAH